MKRFLCLFICIVITLSALLVSCGNGNGTESASPSEVVSAPDESSSAQSEEPSKEISEEISEPESYDLTAEDVAFEEEGSIVFTSPKLKGKTLVYDKAADVSGTFPYPFFAAEEELFTVAWSGDTARAFKGNYVTDGATLTQAFGVLSGGTFACFPAEGSSVRAEGKLVIYTGENGGGTVVYAFPEYARKALSASSGEEHTEVFRTIVFDELINNENSSYLFICSEKFALENKPSFVVFEKTTGYLCQLPLTADQIHYVEKMEYDTGSSDPDAVRVILRYGEREETVGANLKNSLPGIEERNYYPGEKDTEPKPVDTLMTKKDIKTVIDYNSFTSDLYPGKTLIYAGSGGIAAAETPYPFFIQGENIFSFTIDGGEIPVYEGKLVTASNGSPVERSAYGYLYNGRLEYEIMSGEELMELGDLLITYQTKYSESSYFFGNINKLPDYVNSSFLTMEIRENSKYIIYMIERWFSSEPEWRVIDTDGNIYTLPVPDEKHWSVKNITFDTESYATGDVLVYCYDYADGEEGPPRPVPFRANLSECRKLNNEEEYLAYYCESPVADDPVPEELVGFAPETLKVYKDLYPASTWESEEFAKESEKEIADFVHSFDPGFSVDAKLVNAWGFVRASYGLNNGTQADLECRAGGWLRIDSATGRVAGPFAVRLTTKNLLEQDIPLLDEMISYYGFDRSKLKVTADEEGFIIAEYEDGVIPYAEACGMRCIELSVYNNAVEWIRVTVRSAEGAEERKAISFAEASKRLEECRFEYDRDVEERITDRPPDHILGVKLVYVSTVEDDGYVYPYYRFDAKFDDAYGSEYVYVRAVED